MPDEDFSALIARAMRRDGQRFRHRVQKIHRLRQQNKPTDRLRSQLHHQAETSAALVQRRRATTIELAYPDALPISGHREQILGLLHRHQVLVLTGETGSGKTTQLPKMLWEAGCGARGMIGVTQPRRVAAMSIARRLREEMQAPEEAIVHSVRFDDGATDKTLVRIMTDGLLLAELPQDRLLDAYDAVIIDEAHERSLNIDVLLGHLKQLLAKRSDLKVIVTSASIDAQSFAQFLSAPERTVPVLAVGGRAYPVELRYKETEDSDLGYLAATVEAITTLHESEGAGDVLAFLPTERDILEASKRLARLPAATVLPLFSRLNAHEQQRVFATTRGRKIVLSTNIAETSVTVPGITFVVDAGLARVKRYAAGARTERLPIEAIAQASAIQRAGRAGRTGPGVCVRLYTEADFQARPAYTEPEIARSNLAGVLLQLTQMQMGAAETFPWLSPPRASAWSQARQLLHEIGALKKQDEQWLVTRLGRQMAGLACDPQLARMLIAGVQEGVAHEVCTVAAFLSVQDPRLRPLGEESKADAAQQVFRHESGDIMTIVQLWQAYAGAPSVSARKVFAQKHFLGFRRLREWADVRRQLWQQMRGMRALGTLPERGHADGSWPIDTIHRAVLQGMIGSACRFDARERCYRTAGNRAVHLHPASALFRSKQQRDERKGKQPPMPAWLVACEQVETTRVFIRHCAPIQLPWLIAAVEPFITRSHRDPHFDPERGQVSCFERLTWKGLELQSDKRVAYARIDAAAAQQIFIERGLVAGELKQSYAFLERNRVVLKELCAFGDRLRDHRHVPSSDRLTDFYTRALSIAERGICSAKDLSRFIRQHGDETLHLRLEELLPPAELSRARREFPTQVRIGGRSFPVHYRFCPGDEHDGATVILDEGSLSYLPSVDADRLIPGLLRDKVAAALRSLPKDIRRRLIPLAETVDSLLPDIDMSTQAVMPSLTQLLQNRLSCYQSELRFGALPSHVQLRFELRAADASILHSGRDVAVLLGMAGVSVDPLAKIRADYESSPSTSWPGLIAEFIERDGTKYFPALVRTRGTDAGIAVKRTVFAHRVAAAAWHADGIEAVLEASLDQELTALASHGGIAEPSRCRIDASAVAATFQRPLAAWRRHAGVALVRELIPRSCRTEEEFAELLATARTALLHEHACIDETFAAAVQAVTAVKKQLQRGVAGLAAAARVASIARELKTLTDPVWVARLTWPAFKRLPLYLTALQWRLESAPKQADDRKRQHLQEAWDDVWNRVSYPMLQALGFVPPLRVAWSQVQELVLAWSHPQRARQLDAPAGGASEGAVKEVLWNIEKAVTRQQKVDAEVRDRLLEIRPFLQRCESAPMQINLLKQLDMTVRDLPDLSVGGDWQLQSQCAQDLLERIRTFMH